MPVYRLGSVSVAFNADTQEFEGDIKEARRAMEFFRRESKRTGESVGVLAQRAGLTEKNLKELARAERIAVQRTRALNREMRRLERQMRRLRGSHLSFRNVLFTIAGSAGLGLAIRNLTQYSAQVSETADSLGLLPSELDRTRRVLGSFGLDIQQTDRLLANIIAKVGEARRGSQRLQQAFITLGGSLDFSNPLKQLDLIAENFHRLDRTEALEALRLVAGERFAIPVGGLLATPGQFEAELARVAEKFKDFSDTAVRINKNLDQTFIDLFGVLRIHFQNVIADNAAAISDLVQHLEDAIPAIASFTDKLLGFALNNRLSVSLGTAGLFAGASGAGIISRLAGGAGIVGLLTNPIALAAGTLAGIGVITGKILDNQRQTADEAKRYAEFLQLAEDIQAGRTQLGNRTNDEILLLGRIQEAEEEYNRVIQRYQNLSVRDGVRATLFPGFRITDNDIEFVTARERAQILERQAQDAARALAEARRVYAEFIEGTREAEEALNQFENISRIQQQVLREEIDNLEQSTLAWQNYGAELQTLTTRRDVQQLLLQLSQLRAFNTQTLGQIDNFVGSQLDVKIAQLEKTNILLEQELSLTGKIRALAFESIRSEVLQQERTNRLQQERFNNISQLERLNRLTFDNEISTLRETNLLLEHKLTLGSRYSRIVNEQLENELLTQRELNQIASLRFQRPSDLASIDVEKFRGELLTLEESNRALLQRTALIRDSDQFIARSLDKQIQQQILSNLIQGRRLGQEEQLRTLQILTIDSELDGLQRSNLLLADKITLTQQLEERTLKQFENEILKGREALRLQRLRNELGQTDFQVLAGLNFNTETEALRESVTLLEYRLHLLRTQGDDFIALTRLQEALRREERRILSQDVDTLFVKAVDRAVSGLGMAVSELSNALIKGEQVFNSFANALQRMINSILQLFTEAAIINLAQRFNLPGFSLNTGAAVGSTINNTPTQTVGANLRAAPGLEEALTRPIEVTNNYRIQSVDAAGVVAAIENLEERIADISTRASIVQVQENSEYREAHRQALL